MFRHLRSLWRLTTTTKLVTRKCPKIASAVLTRQAKVRGLLGDPFFRFELAHQRHRLRRRDCLQLTCRMRGYTLWLDASWARLSGAVNLIFETLLELGRAMNASGDAVRRRGSR